ncbi:LAFA_0E21044g1_1 [Lachancea sp. 'fantastica']|nr:LAFA_0E21044g1_1 [Lachancea sp. 'fantastica']
MFPEHDLKLDQIRLTENPIDDYQRTWLATDERQPPHVTRSRYRTCAVQGFHDVLTSGAAATLSPASSVSPSSPSSTSLSAPASQTRSGLDCSEYLFPDVLSHATLTQPQPVDQEHQAQPHQNQHRGSSNGDLNSLTKNQQFRLRQIQYSDQHVSRAINPNNCVLWDHHTGYVFFTGIWRLYQDVMHVLVSLDRPDGPDAPDGLDRKAHCQLELDYVLFKCLYEQPQPIDSETHFSRRKPASKRGNRRTSVPNTSNTSTSASATAAAAAATASASSSPHYSDIHWHNLDAQLKQDLCRIYRENYHPNREFEFHDLMKRIRGGYIKIQGTWLPFELAKSLCIRFCFPIRYLLVPIFGPAFPRECEGWYETFVGLFPPKKSTNEARSTSTVSTVPVKRARDRPKKLDFSKVSSFKKARVDAELLDASQNLLKLSRNNMSPRTTNPAVPVSPMYRNRASSWSPGFNTSPNPMHPSHLQALPPIKPLLDSLECNYPSPPNSATFKNNKTNAGNNTEYFSSPLGSDTRYFSPPVSPGYSSSSTGARFHGVGAINDTEFNFVATPNSSLALRRQPKQPATALHPSMENTRTGQSTLGNIAHFYNSHGHKYTYPGGMQVMYHPQNIQVSKEQQQHQLHQSQPSGKDDFSVGV